MADSGTKFSAFRDLAVGIAALISSIAIPLAGIMYADAQKKAEVSKDYVALAATLLARPPSDDSKPDPTREWAIQVIDRYSEVKISKSVAADFRARPISVKEIMVPVAVPCTVELSPPPNYPDTKDALVAAKDSFERTKLLLAGRILRVAREDELSAVLAACGATAAD